MPYRHTQTGWPMRIAFGTAAIGLLVMAALPPFDQPWTRAVLVGGAVLCAALGVAWSRLSIEIDRTQVRWWFGTGWPRFSLPLPEIVAVETTRTTFWQGWGIHRTRIGWLYNIAGYGAVLITRRDGRRVLLGTDEPRRLKAALDRALPRA
jgi:hypothetical protein